MSLFSTLTPELQDLIWQQAIASSPPRNVHLRLRPLTPTSDHKICISAAPIPPLLHACSRSRALALRRWRLSFPEERYHADYNTPEQPPPSPAPRVFFDPVTDFLLLYGADRDGREDEHIPVLDRTRQRFTGTEEVRNLACEYGALEMWSQENYILFEPDYEDEDDDDQQDPGEQQPDEDAVEQEMTEVFPSLRRLVFVLNRNGLGKVFDAGAIEKIAESKELRNNLHDPPRWIGKNFVDAYRAFGAEEELDVGVVFLMPVV